MARSEDRYCDCHGNNTQQAGTGCGETAAPALLGLRGSASGDQRSDIRALAELDRGLGLVPLLSVCQLDRNEQATRTPFILPPLDRRRLESAAPLFVDSMAPDPAAKLWPC